MKKANGALLLFTGCLTMGSMGVFAHFIESTHPINILLFRYSFTLIALLIILGLMLAFTPAKASGYLSQNLNAAKQHPRIYAAAGLVSAMVMATYVFGTLLFSLGLSVVMLYTASIYLPFTEKMMRRFFFQSLPKSSFGAKYYISSAINLTGLLLIVGASIADTKLNVIGLISAISSGFIFSIMMVMVRVLSSKGFEPEQTLISGTLAGFILFIPFAFILPISFSAHNIAAATGLGAFATAIGGIFYFKGFNAVRPDLAPLLAYFEPIFGSILALLFLGEHYSSIAVAGVILIMGSNFAYTIITSTKQKV